MGIAESHISLPVEIICFAMREDSQAENLQ